MSDNESNRNGQPLYGVTRRQMLIAPALMGLGLATGLNRLSFAATIDNVRGQGTPTRGGMLMRLSQGDPPNFDTLGNSTGRLLYIAGPCYSGLMRYDELDPDKIVPELAESYDVSPDG